MQFTPMTPDERARLAAALVGTNPAAPELVASAVDAALKARHYPAAASVAASRKATAVDAVPALARRLLAVEDTLDTARRTLARVIDDAQDDAADIDPLDLLDALRYAGLPLDDHLAETAEQRRAAARAGALA